MARIIYIGDLNMNFSIMDSFQGKGQLYVENPWYTPNGVKPFDNKNYYTKSGASSSMGTYLKGPHLYWRKAITDPFSKNTKICLTLSKDHKVYYRISKPYSSDGSSTPIKTNMKLTVSINSSPSFIDVLELLDSRLLTLYEISFTCMLLGIKLDAYKDLDNNAFWVKFDKEFSDSVAELMKSKGKPLKTPIVVDPKYKMQWDSPMYLCRSSNVSYRLVNITPDDYEACLESPQQYSYSTILMDVISKTSFAGLKKEHMMFPPMLFKKLYVKDNDAKMFDNTSLMFKCKLDGSKVPDALITTRMSKRNGKIVNDMLTPANISELWGGDKPSATLYGFMLVNIDFDYTFYKIATSCVKWTVTSYNGTYKSASASVDIREDDMPDLEASDDDDAPATSHTTSTPLRKADDDDIVVDDDDM